MAGIAEGCLSLTNQTHTSGTLQVGGRSIETFRHPPEIRQWDLGMWKLGSLEHATFSGRLGFLRRQNFNGKLLPSMAWNNGVWRKCGLRTVSPRKASRRDEFSAVGGVADCSRLRCGWVLRCRVAGDRKALFLLEQQQMPHVSAAACRRSVLLCSWARII